MPGQLQINYENTTGKQMLTKEECRKQREDIEVRKQNDDNHKEIIELERSKLREETKQEVKAPRMLKICGHAEDDNPSEDKAELESQRNPTGLDTMSYFP